MLCLPTVPGAEMTEISNKLHYDREVVRVWFCNKRQALKNTIKKLKAEDAVGLEAAAGTGQQLLLSTTADLTAVTDTTPTTRSMQLDMPPSAVLNLDMDNRGLLPSSLPMNLKLDNQAVLSLAADKAMLANAVSWKPEKTLAATATMNLAGKLPANSTAAATNLES